MNAVRYEYSAFLVHFLVEIRPTYIFFPGSVIAHFHYYRKLNGGGHFRLMEVGIATPPIKRSRLILTLRRQLPCPPRLIL